MDKGQKPPLPSLGSAKKRSSGACQIQIPLRRTRSANLGASSRYRIILLCIRAARNTHWKRVFSLRRKNVKIAQIAPLAESVPPRMYGGTERIVSYLTEELVKLGHEVTLFASGDSITSGNLVSCATTALRLDPSVKDIIPYYMLMLDG
jgi:hypothetical protein